MAATYDVIVIGLGGMGSATAYQLAARGQRVLGLERYAPAHDHGSSHGQSRIIRQAYFEDPAYVPLLLRAYELWRQLEAETGQDLLVVTGGLMLGAPDSHVVQGAIRSAKEWNLAHEILDAAAIRRRFPLFTPHDNEIALYETEAGFVRPEAGVTAHLDRATALGATLHFNEPVIGWSANTHDGTVRVATAQGSYETAQLVITPGAWAPDLLQRLGLPLEVERQVMYWFAPEGGDAPFQPDQFPIYIWETLPGVTIYGFPSSEGPGSGAKVAFFRVPGPHHVTTPEVIDREIHSAEIDQMRSAIAERIPALNGAFLRAKTCMYTNTPDEHFVITNLPESPQITIAAGFSGHGYKFASVVGEILADLATTGTTNHPIDLFNLQRFGG